MSGRWLRNTLEILMVVVMIGAAGYALLPAQRYHSQTTLDAGRMRYDGQMRKGKFNGHGTLALKNGDRYVGDFTDGRFDGQGTFVSHEGWRYRGEFVDGALTGKGTLTTKQGKRYKGYFKNGQYHASTD